MEIVLAVLCGFILDWLLGDPDWMPHPVVYMGKAIRALESVLRKIFRKAIGGSFFLERFWPYCCYRSALCCPLAHFFCADLCTRFWPLACKAYGAGSVWRLRG